jgi:hypothetical protein
LSNRKEKHRRKLAPQTAQAEVQLKKPTLAPRQWFLYLLIPLTAALVALYFFSGAVLNIAPIAAGVLAIVVGISNWRSIRESRVKVALITALLIATILSGIAQRPKKSDRELLMAFATGVLEGIQDEVRVAKGEEIPMARYLLRPGSVRVSRVEDFLVVEISNPDDEEVMKATISVQVSQQSLCETAALPKNVSRFLALDGPMVAICYSGYTMGIGSDDSESQGVIEKRLGFEFSLWGPHGGSSDERQFENDVRRYGAIAYRKCAFVSVRNREIERFDAKTFLMIIYCPETEPIDHSQGREIGSAIASLDIKCRLNRNRSVSAFRGIKWSIVRGGIAEGSSADQQIFKRGAQIVD